MMDGWLDGRQSIRAVAPPKATDVGGFNCGLSKFVSFCGGNVWNHFYVRQWQGRRGGHMELQEEVGPRAKGGTAGSEKLQISRLLWASL